MTTQVEAIFGVIFDLDGTLVSSELDFALIKGPNRLPLRARLT